jgi:secondary thiamine-phosphate synthase enzyme
MAGAEFRVRTKKKIARINVTQEVERVAKELRAKSGALLVSVPHTTAAVSVGETWDEDVVTDMERALAEWVPNVRFDHAEGNSPAHFLSESIGTSCIVPLEDGKPLLGRWQGIVLIELDGPRERTVRVHHLAGG